MDKMRLYGGMGLALVAIALAATQVAYAAGGGMVGYHKNDIFVGTGYQWCSQKLGWNQSTCASYLGASAADKVVMKWNAQWDNCNAAGGNNETACKGAWEDNEWNGMAGGDGGVWHYKIIWVGAAGANSAYWIPGGESVWGCYEILMDQGTASGSHQWIALAAPDGYGS